MVDDLIHNTDKLEVQDPRSTRKGKKNWGSPHDMAHSPPGEILSTYTTLQREHVLQQRLGLGRISPLLEPPNLLHRVVRAIQPELDSNQTKPLFDNK